MIAFYADLHAANAAGFVLACELCQRLGSHRNLLTLSRLVRPSVSRSHGQKYLEREASAILRIRHDHGSTPVYRGVEHRLKTCIRATMPELFGPVLLVEGEAESIVLLLRPQHLLDRGRFQKLIRPRFARLLNRNRESRQIR